MNEQRSGERDDAGRNGHGRSGPPIGRAFVGFVAAVVGVVVLIGVGAASPGLSSSGTELGVMAVTLFSVAGLLCAYRAVMARDRLAGLIVVVFHVPGTAWSWLAFVASAQPDRRSAAVVGVVGAALAVTLLVRGFRSGRWLEVFSGLGALALALAATLVRIVGISTAVTSTLALLVAVAAMTSLYGLLVDIEVSEHRSHAQLRLARVQLESESRRNQELLHDLRSGLLSIEAASGTWTDGMAEPVRCEAARLRRLTAPAETAPAPVWFDLAPGLSRLVEARRAGGVRIDVRAPAEVIVHGDECELLAVVENLLSNALRHGREPIMVELVDHGRTARLTVSDAGEGVEPSMVETVFRRGVSSHPDGLGIGLDRGRLLAERNGAELVLDVTSGGGASFALVMRSKLGIGVR